MTKSVEFQQPASAFMEKRMHHHLIIVSYKGSRYFGWQDLGATEQKPTIQSIIHQVLKKICKYQHCSISGASRTDAGVHAQGQVAKLTLPIKIESEKLLRGMNSQLPGDIRIQHCEPCAKEFNPNKDSKSKEYHYYFSTDKIDNPILNDFVYHVTPGDNNPMDLELMKSACTLFIGEHDFYNFATRDDKIKSTIRNIDLCEIIKADTLDFSQDTYYLKIKGNGFLKHMIRYIAGTLFEVGRGNINLSEINEALKNRQEHKPCPKTKAKGLHLIEICY